MCFRVVAGIFGLPGKSTRAQPLHKRDGFKEEGFTGGRGNESIKYPQARVGVQDSWN